MIDEAERLKADADKVVNDLPAGDEKTKFQGRLDKLSDLNAPDITDKDSDGKLDTEEYTEAEEAVKKAEEAHKKAKEEVDKYPEGSVVDPASDQAIQQLIDEAERLKAEADKRCQRPTSR